MFTATFTTDLNLYNEAAVTQYSQLPTGSRPTAPAQRTRMRRAALLDTSKALICECTLYDLSNGHAGLILSEADREVPDTILIFDERNQLVIRSRISRRDGKYLETSVLEPPIPAYIFLAGPSPKKDTDPALEPSSDDDLSPLPPVS